MSEKIEKVVSEVVAEFPFENYMIRNGRVRDSYFNIAKTVVRFLDKGATVLDFGAGPCDITAVISNLGYKCYAVDDLSDGWHGYGDNYKKISSFVSSVGIEFIESDGTDLPFNDSMFDMIMLHDVIEHFHESPRLILNKLLRLLKPGGLIFITVPNAGNIRKRIELLVGGTNYPRFDTFFWSPGVWRGHVREYVKSDLSLLSQYLSLETVELRGIDNMLQKVPGNFVKPYLFVTKYMDGFKDSWSYIGKKPLSWDPDKVLREGCLDQELKEYKY